MSLGAGKALPPLPQLPLSRPPTPPRKPTPSTTPSRPSFPLTKLSRSAALNRNKPTPPTPLRTPTTPATAPGDAYHYASDDDDDDDDDPDLDMSSDAKRPGLLSRQSEGRSAEPLLENGMWDDEERGRGNTSYEGLREVEERQRRRQEMRSRSPESAALKLAERRKYMIAAVFLVLSLVSFVIQTETAVYIQHELGWHKAYAMLYFTHGSWALLWPTQLLILKLRKPHTPWRPFLKSHFHLLKTTGQMVISQRSKLSVSASRTSPTLTMMKKVAFVTCALTIAGSTWYIAVNLTTPSDLTAIYNCSAFFAYVFSIFMLGEKPRKDKIFAVAVAIAGVLVVAYGDTAKVEKGHELEAGQRVLGNIVIGVGSVMYGFYEVLYKKLACPPEGVSAKRSVIFANAVGSGIGFFTLTILWVPIPLLHWLGWETFEMPTGEAAWMLLISVLANATFSGSFLVLISLTSPVLSSVASLLTIFLVALTDWFITGTPLSAAAILGGTLIIAAFFLLSWSTWREMDEEKRKVEEECVESSEED